jgi:hypothetical protein
MIGDYDRGVMYSGLVDRYQCSEKRKKSKCKKKINTEVITTVESPCNSTTSSTSSTSSTTTTLPVQKKREIFYECESEDDEAAVREDNDDDLDIEMNNVFTSVATTGKSENLIILVQLMR